MSVTINIESSASVADAHEREVRLQVWPKARRVLLGMPVSLDELTMNGPVMRLAMQVCGKDAVVVADIGSRLGGMAFCCKDGVDKWRKELGLSEVAP